MKRFSLLIILRIALITTNVLLLAWIFGNMNLFFNQIILSLILIAQVWELIHYVNHTNRELSRLFMAIKHADFSVTFKQESLGNSFKELQHSMMDIIESYKQVKIEKEAQYQFLQMMINQIHIGIISVQHENIMLINPIAERILGIKNTKNWKLFQQFNPGLAVELEDTGKKLIEVKSDEGIKIVAVEVSTLLMMDKPYKLITLQDINSEIEQKEIEAWHKLIRILTHEIMNSVTPISSLSETMQSMLSDKSGNQKMLQDIEPDTIKDIRFSLDTIHKRSERLLNFVENYRRLTRVPKPVIDSVNINSFLDTIKNLMKEELARQAIDFNVDVENKSLTLKIDSSLIEQVLINLIKNSAQAVEHRQTKSIVIKAYDQHQSSVIELTDNGKGIPEKELREIFIPFFSTKKEGSGIGLSLSKQIMSLHGGRIRVESKVDEGTSFFLVFKKAL